MAINALLILVYVLFLKLILLLYVRLAKKFNVTTSILRNRHRRTVVLGAGLIFPLALVLFAVFCKDISIYFLIGVLLVACVSFIDDLKTVKIIYRLLIQIIACLLVIYSFHHEFKISSDFLFEISFLFFLLIGYLNAYNFMDGINGILGLNSTIILACLMVINIFNPFAETHLLLALIIACILFLTGNFRHKSIFISGDVGSISLGFIIGYFILKNYLINGNPIILLLMAVYFIDVVSTILINLKNGINIFKSHRNHMYEKLVYEKGISDLRISGLYGGIQLVVAFIVVVCSFLKIGSWIMLMLSTLGLIIIYSIFRSLNFPNEIKRKTNN